LNRFSCAQAYDKTFENYAPIHGDLIFKKEISLAQHKFFNTFAQIEILAHSVNDCINGAIEKFRKLSCVQFRYQPTGIDAISVVDSAQV
jgi:hypothetical protein